jgi:hypothetical protein
MGKRHNSESVFFNANKVNNFAHAQIIHQHSEQCLIKVSK